MKKLVEVQVVLSIRDCGGWLGAKTEADGLQKSAEALVAEVKRHCNYYEGHHKNYVYECEHCGHEWEDWSAWPYKDEPDCPLGMPRCCEKAQEEWKTEQASKALKNQEE